VQSRHAADVPDVRGSFDRDCLGAAKWRCLGVGKFGVL
jgi:hypothetical protein